MLLTLHFHPALQAMTNVKSHTFEVDKLSSIKDALVVLFPKLRNYIRNIGAGRIKENLSLITLDKKIVNKIDYYKDVINHKELWLVPIIEGSGGRGGFLSILLGIVLIAAAFWLGGAPGFLGGAGFSGSTSAFGGLVTAGGLLKMGIGLVLTGLMSLLMKPPSPPSNTNENQQRRNNDMFDALENTTDTNNSVPLIYGRPRVAGQVLSLHVETMTHGEKDTIYVSDLFHSNSDEIEKTG